MTSQTLTPNAPQKTVTQRLSTIVPTVIIIAVIIWAFTGIEFNGIGQTWQQVTGAILNGFMNPDFEYVYNGSGEDLVGLMILTLAIALVGTLISIIGAIPFAFLSAANRQVGMSRKPKIVSGIGLLVLAVLRTFPEIVLAVIFVKMVGPGPFAGALAIGVHSIGMLGKLYAEEIEKLPFSPIEGIVAVGGTGLQTLWYAKLPLLMPQFLSLALYRFEIAVRSATILGIVGAGGIGTPIIFAIASRSWDRVAIILIGIVITVTLIDLASGYLRKKLR